MRNQYGVCLIKWAEAPSFHLWRFCHDPRVFANPEKFPDSRTAIFGRADLLRAILEIGNDDGKSLRKHLCIPPTAVVEVEPIMVVGLEEFECE